MNTASLELCKELYELSGWESGFWYVDKPIKDAGAISLSCPKYDLGYLLRKLPRKLNGINSKQRDGNLNMYASRGEENWIVSYSDADDTIVRRLKEGAESQNHRNFWHAYATASSPEDAACSLAIELFKQGVLKHD